MKHASALKRAAFRRARKLKLTHHRKRYAMRRRDHDRDPVREITRSYNVSHSTISRPYRRDAGISYLGISYSLTKEVPLKWARRQNNLVSALQLLGERERPRRG